jgi:hypothetical protein
MLLATPSAICPNAFVLLILCHSIVDNYLMTLVSWGTHIVLSRSSRELMTIPQTLTFGQRRFCRRHIIPSLKCPVLKLQQLSLPRTSKISGNWFMKGHQFLSAESPSCITRQWHCILCLGAVLIKNHTRLRHGEEEKVVDAVATMEEDAVGVGAVAAGWEDEDNETG